MSRAIGVLVCYLIEVAEGADVVSVPRTLVSRFKEHRVTARWHAVAAGAPGYSCLCVVHTVIITTLDFALDPHSWEY